jgi:Aminopeptidase N
LLRCKPDPAGLRWGRAEKHYPPDLELEPVHLDITLRVDLHHQTACGTVTTTVLARRTGVNELVLSAVQFDNVEAQDSEGQPIHFRYDGERLTARWEEPFSAGETRRLAISYRVVKPAAGLYFSQPTTLYPDQPWFAATDHETERARYWLPSIDLPNVRTTLEFHLRAGSNFTILANGRLLDEQDHGDGTKTAHWRLDQRCPSYLVCFAIGDFIQADDGDFNGISIAYFASRRFSEADLMRTFGRTRQILKWMTDKLGMPFPFPKYYQFALPDFGGAMENISLVSWDDRFVLDETLAREWSWLVDQINVHEMAHSYFGDAVVCRDYAHAWLKESWATYMEQCWLEDNRGEDEKLYDFYCKAMAYFAEADKHYTRPLVTREFKSSWQMYDRHLYPGGACRLHTLRCELSDEVFWAGVSDYLKRYSGKVVETDDFRRVLEEHSGRSLVHFFEQWFFTPAYLALKVSFSYEEKRKEGSFQVEQTQVDEEKGKPVFVVATEVGWIIDGEAHRHPVTLKHRQQTITVPMRKAPDHVRFDPSCKLLHKLNFNPGDTLLRHQLKEAPDVIGRILAAHELAKTGKRGNIQAIVDAYKEERFFGVRQQFAKALGNAGAECAIEGLVKLIETEQDPMVQESVLRAAGKYRDPRIREAVIQRLELGLPYRAAQAALEALGAQRQDAPWDRLVEAAGREEFSGFVQSGALRALAATRRSEAIPLLMEHVPYGMLPSRTRPAAVAALADIGSVQEKPQREPILEKLLDLLRDPAPSVRKAAAQGLKTLRAAQAVSALEAYRRTLALQDQVEVDRILKAIKEGAGPPEEALKKQLEELQEKYRKLENRLQQLEERVS